RTQCRRNVIRSTQDRLTSRSGISSRHIVCSHEAGAYPLCFPAASRQWIWISLAIHLAVGIGRPRRRALVDGKLRAVVSDVVVGDDVGWAKRGRNVIGRRTRALSRHTAVSHCYQCGVRRDKPAAGAGSQRIRIRFAIDLTRRIGRPGRIYLIDLIGNRRCGSRGDVVVIPSTGKAPGVSEGTSGCTDVGRAAYINGPDGRPRLATYTVDRCDGRSMRIAIIRHVVRGDHYVGVRIRNSQGIAATAATKREVATEVGGGSRRVW